MTAAIFITFTEPGFHRWPNAPGAQSYLAHRHRHLFGVTVRMHVHDDDREVEFHALKDEARSLWPPGGELGTRSCEAMARELAEKLSRRYQRRVEVEVSEDGECGAVVVIDAKKNPAG